ncbi:SURF1 family protein [Pseudoduganella chitinolytica]|uniref:SURF1-like protein n=1 Tax=Pseudoduganella chitinolytica TaxID=34070 RepID=A0ABY8BHM0_9BURK|nr:SURF1 family protein [Pseudoduganella chitinolytica]WEF34416.1 SURF1 family protein [Pseudoduganella chitinolytica]
MMAAARGTSGGKIVLAACAVLLFCVFAALGTWQVKRLQWKLDLVERVNTRVHATPVPAPGPEQWARVTAESDEYRRVRVSGKFLYEFTTPVQTTTAKGIGFWLMTPLCLADGTIVFVNRGFVPMKSGDLDKPAPPRATTTVCAPFSQAATQKQTPGSDPAGLTPASAVGGEAQQRTPGSGRSAGMHASTASQARSCAPGNPCDAPAGPTPALGLGSGVEITGLLRMPEPKGRLLRENDPAHDRWYVRDVPAIAARRNLRNVAPYFVDAPAGLEYPRDASEKPVGGLTVIAFPNNHLVYALTWFALAAMVAGGYYLVLRYEKRKTRARNAAND